MGAYRIQYSLFNNGRREDKETIVKRCRNGAQAEDKLKVWCRQKGQRIEIHRTVYKKNSDYLEYLTSIFNL